VAGLPTREDFVVSDQELWTGDGSTEPPECVTKVRDAAGDIVERNEHGWWWMTITGIRQERDATNGWAWFEMASEGPYTEVAS
jgi:hypothetical protein